MSWYSILFIRLWAYGGGTLSGLFDSAAEHRSWTTIRDLSPSLLQGYREHFAKRPSATLFQPEDDVRFEKRKCRNERLIQIARHEIGRWDGLLPVAYFFLLADEEGYAIHLHCPSELSRPLQKAGLREGVCFSLLHLGINGISMAMERQTIVAVRGQEHDVELLHSLNCLCVPIRSKDQTVGYLDMSFSRQHEIEFAIPILLQIVDKIERKLSDDAEEKGKQRLFEVFDQYRLTAREKEAAYGWLRNYSALRIAEEMGITEGTVRNLIKKVYAKTKQGDKGNFIQEFIQWL